MKNLSGLAISMAMLLAVAFGIHRSVKVPMLKHGKRLFGGEAVGECGD